MVAQDYARIYRANSILTATPGQLVLLLFDGALRAMGTARAAFERPARDLGRFEVIHRNLTKARRIIAELRGTLNFEAGGEFAALMERLYEYYNRRLLEANLKKTPEPILEIEQLLGQVRDAWAEMLKKEGVSVAAAPAPEPILS
ncbi:MAG: flagellar export chaperone FliS [Opitutaceae bacterium]